MSVPDNNTAPSGSAKLFAVVCLILMLSLTGCPSQSPVTLGISGFNYLPALNDNERVAHTHYALSYAESHEQAEWVAYELTAAEVAVNIPREGNFREDPQVSTGSAALDDYRGSGYDRGHLAPVGDMNFDTVAMEESFYMSNVSPQDRAFNGGIWSRLENKVRDWADEKGSVYVITGPVLGEAQNSIGENAVTVPDFFYKVVLNEQGENSEMIGFMMPNRAGQGNLANFVEKVDNIEAYTGIDFFPLLADSLEERLERETMPGNWF